MKRNNSDTLIRKREHLNHTINLTFQNRRLAHMTKKE